MSYWILTANGIPVSKETVQCVTYLETCTNANNKRFGVYDNFTKEIFHDKYTEEAFAGPRITKPTMEMWAELAEYEEDF